MRRTGAWKDLGRRAEEGLPPLVGGLVVLGGWYGLGAALELPGYLLPRPHQVVRALGEEWATLGPAAGATLLAATLGLVATIGGAMLGALGLTASRWGRRAIFPYVVMAQLVPILATAAIIVMLFDVGLPSVVLVSFLISFFPLLAVAVTGMRSVSPEAVDLFRFYGATRWQELWLLRLPRALPMVLAGTRVAATLAVVGAVTGEIFAGTVDGGGGLGFAIVRFRAQARADGVFAAALLCVAIGGLLQGVVVTLGARLIRPERHDMARER